MRDIFRRLVSFTSSGGILGNSAATAGIKASAFGVRVLAMLWTAQKVEPAAFGVLVLYMTCAEFSRIVADFGLDTRLTGMFANKSTGHGGLIKQALVLKILMGGLVGISFLMFVIWMGLASSPLLPAFLLMVVSPLILSLPANYKIARQEGYQALGISVLGGLLSLATFLGLFVIPSVGMLAFYVIPIAELLVAAWLFHLLPVKEILEAPVSSSALKQLARTSVPVGIAIVLGAAYGRMDMFFVNHFSTTADLGIYGFSARLVEPLAFVGGALAVNTYSHVSGIVYNDSKNGAAVLMRYGKVVGLYAFACGLAVTLFAILLMNSLFPLYASGLWMVLIFAAIIVCRCMNLFFTAGIQGYGGFALISKIAGLNFIGTLVLMIILVPTFGALGAALAIFGVEFLNCLLQPWLLFKIVRAAQ